MGGNILVPRTLTRRQKLIIKHTLISLSLVVVASGVVYVLRERPQPYAPGEAVEGISSELERSIPAGYLPIRFTDVAAQAGINYQHFRGTRSTQLPEDMGSGAAWGDYDGDGFADLYVCNIAGPLTASPEEIAASPAGNRLYHNNRDGTFTDVTTAAGVGFKGTSMGAAWADFDNDGDLDLVVTNYDHLLLYRNRGDGTFEDVTRAAGLGNFRGFWTGASWSDYDRDGNVDLYICGYVQYVFRPEFTGSASRQFTATVPFMLNPSSYPPARNLLFRNNGNGTFTEVAKAAGVDNPTGRSLAAAWADYNADGWPDLYVANDISDNVMYLNLRNGRFKDISHPAWVADYRGAMGLGVGDWDRDGDLDIFVTHWMAQENALYSNLLITPGTVTASAPTAETPVRNVALAADSSPRRPQAQPQLRFQDIADMEGLGQIALSVIGWGTSFFDYNNDGLLDLLVVNGSTFQDEHDPTKLVPLKNFLFWNHGPEEGYFEVGASSGPAFREVRVGRGAALADYDNDGNVDIFILNHSGRPWLLRNEGDKKNHWLKVRVRGTKSNRAGFGARVEVEAGGQNQIQEIGSQPSYLSQNALEAHFGLGAAAQADRLTVRFPSGVVRELRQVSANQTLTVEEGGS
jgi:hypothetical protein